MEQTGEDLCRTGHECCLLSHYWHMLSLFPNDLNEN